MDDIVLVEMDVEGGKRKATREVRHFVGRILGAEEDGRWAISFLRMKSSLIWNVFVFPDIPDVDVVARDCVLGVLNVVPSSSHRQANTVTVSPGLHTFNML